MWKINIIFAYNHLLNKVLNAGYSIAMDNNRFGTRKITYYINHI